MDKCPQPTGSQIFKLPCPLFHSMISSLLGGTGVGWEGADVNTLHIAFFQAMQKLPRKTGPWSVHCRAMPLSRQRRGRPQGALLQISEFTSPTLPSFLLLISPFQLILTLNGQPCLLSTHLWPNVMVVLQSPKKPFPPLSEVLPTSPPAEYHLPLNKSISTISGYHKCNKIKSPNSLLNRSRVLL